MEYEPNNTHEIVTPERLSLATTLLKRGHDRFIGEVIGHDNYAIHLQLEQLEANLSDELIELEEKFDELDESRTMSSSLEEIITLEFDLNEFIHNTVGIHNGYELVDFDEGNLWLGLAETNKDKEVRIHAASEPGRLKVSKVVVDFRAYEPGQTAPKMHNMPIEAADMTGVANVIAGMFEARDRLDTLIEGASSPEELARSIPRYD